VDLNNNHDVMWQSGVVLQMYISYQIFNIPLAFCSLSNMEPIQGQKCRPLAEDSCKISSIDGFDDETS
jgi:hypothetical protein